MCVEKIVYRQVIVILYDGNKSFKYSVGREISTLIA
jgi:hypothetical protein